ncbi:MAG: phosphatidylserine/phosphatidylglycerophosphate/cardiolipin synthase family protein [Acholeplasma sp.]|nr:phosphatidylserine/phosphatidylglycerophosphate/cardiolipin synthase family protein [Acholeplasma sp.]
MKLLIKGNEAFTEIIRMIDNAKDSILIRMFIWRDDKIGNEILRHLVDAANRGIKITVYKDIYGAIFEKSEENRKSLFHKKTPFSMNVSAFFMANLIYFHSESPRFVKQETNELVTEFLEHKNVVVYRKKFYDHTKYYIIDNKTIVIGGINIEDKEYDADYQGRKYQDYMVLINNSQELVDKLTARMNNQIEFNHLEKTNFLVNKKHQQSALKDIMSLLDKTTKRVYMSMAYFGNKQIRNKLISLKKSGIEVIVVTSRISNVQDSLNKYELKKLYQNDIDVYFHPGLVHAKTMLVDDLLMLGSINLNNASLKKMGECSLCTRDMDLIKEWLKDFERLKQECIKAEKKAFKYNRIKYFFEKIFG